MHLEKGTNNLWFSTDERYLMGMSRDEPVPVDAATELYYTALGRYEEAIDLGEVEALDTLVKSLGHLCNWGEEPRTNDCKPTVCPALSQDNFTFRESIRGRQFVPSDDVLPPDMLELLG